MTSIPTKSITVDGLADDWNGMGPLISSPEGCNRPQCIAGSDVKNLWLARDGKSLFFLFETWTPVDTTGEAAYRLWFDNNQNGQLDDDPLDRQVSAVYSEGHGGFRVWCQTMAPEGQPLDVDSNVAADNYFVEGRVDACMLDIADRLDLHSGTHSHTSISNYDRFQVVEDMDGTGFECLR